MVFGWLIPCFFVLTVAASLAELTSAMPYVSSSVTLVFESSLSVLEQVLVYTTSPPNLHLRSIRRWQAGSRVGRTSLDKSPLYALSTSRGKRINCHLYFINIVLKSYVADSAQMITTAIAVSSDGATNLGLGPTYGILLAILFVHGFVCSAATKILARLNLIYVAINSQEHSLLKLDFTAPSVTDECDFAVGTSVAAIIALLVGSRDNNVSSKDAFTMFENNTGWANSSYTKWLLDDPYSTNLKS